MMPEVGQLRRVVEGAPGTTRPPNTKLLVLKLRTSDTRFGFADICWEDGTRDTYTQWWVRIWTEPV